MRLLAPFDPVVWDRPRFECFWGWDYRFEAYMPPAKRRFRYCALPLLRRGAVFRRALEAEARADAVGVTGLAIAAA